MPSAQVLAAKQQQVDGLVEQLKGASAGVIVDYTGITVEDVNALRKELRQAGVSYRVIKNTLIKRAFAQTGFEKLDDNLNGMTAIVISPEDPIAAAKIVKKYADKVESFNIKAGFADGELLSAKEVESLAATPSKEILIGKVLGSLQSSLYSLAYALQAIVDKNGEAATEPAA